MTKFQALTSHCPCGTFAHPNRLFRLEFQHSGNVVSAIHLYTAPDRSWMLLYRADRTA